MRARLIPLDSAPVIELVKDLTLVGRNDDCDVRLDHKSVSKLHCILVKTDGLVLVRDLGSTNGTRVNGQRVRRAALLPDDQLAGTGLRIADSILVGIPVVGERLSFLLLGGEFPGLVIERMYWLHVAIVPVALLAVLTLRYRLALRRLPAQFPGRGRSENAVVGLPLPAVLVRAVGLFLVTTAVLIGLGVGLLLLEPLDVEADGLEQAVRAELEAARELGDDLLRVGEPLDRQGVLRLDDLLEPDAGRRHLGVDEREQRRRPLLGLLQVVDDLDTLLDTLDLLLQRVELLAVALELLGDHLLFGQLALGLVEHRLGLEHCRLGGLEHCVHAPQDAHGQDHVGVLAALEQVAQDVVGDAPDEGDDLVVGGLVHVWGT